MKDDLRARLESYFLHNPGDGLTVKDAAVKFTTERLLPMLFYVLI
jgi:hypothetical protein